MNDLMSGGLHRLWKDHLVHETLRPFSGQRHLDVAGGTGDVGFRVLRAIRKAEAQSKAPEPGSVVVCDISPEMLEEGKKKAEQASDLARDKGLSFVEGNAESLSFPDASFDSYTIAFGIRNVTDRDAALREAYRVLKPGGRFLCLEFSHITQPGLREAYDLYSFNVIPRIGGLVANDTESYQYLVESIRKFPDQEAFAGMIKAAGFRAVTYENLNLGLVAMHSGFKL
jgi:2-methoxy-6-polyprenyl-1,4-benzoquinol methylase